MAGAVPGLGAGAGAGVAVAAAAGAAVGTAVAAGAGPAITVNVALAWRLLVSPIAVTPNEPASSCGIVNGSAKLPDVSAVVEPIFGPLKLTSTVSPGWKPEPLMVMAAPGSAWLVENVT